MKPNLAAMTALAASLVLTAAVGANGAPNLDFKSSLGTGSGLSNSPATADAAGPAAVGTAAARRWAVAAAAADPPGGCLAAARAAIPSKAAAASALKADATPGAMPTKVGTAAARHGTAARTGIAIIALTVTARITAASMAPTSSSAVAMVRLRLASARGASDGQPLLVAALPRMPLTLANLNSG